MSSDTVPEAPAPEEGRIRVPRDLDAITDVGGESLDRARKTRHHLGTAPFHRHHQSPGLVFRTDQAGSCRCYLDSGLVGDAALGQDPRDRVEVRITPLPERGEWGPPASPNDR